MKGSEHKERHQVLHRFLDELLADFIAHNNKTLMDTTLMEFIEWSHQQTINPTESPSQDQP